MARLLVKHSKGVDVSQRHDLVHPVPLNPQEPGDFLIVFGSRQIDLVVCGVVVTADDEKLSLLSLPLPMFQNGFVETELVVQPHLVPFSIWKIDVVEVKFRERRDKDPAFAVKFRHAKAKLCRQWFLSRVSCNPTVALLLAGAPVALVTR